MSGIDFPREEICRNFHFISWYYFEFLFSLFDVRESEGCEFPLVFLRSLGALSLWGRGQEEEGKEEKKCHFGTSFLFLALRTKNQHTESIDNIRFVRGNMCVTHFFRPSRAGIHLRESRTVSKLETNIFCLWKCLVSSSGEGKEKIALQISCPKETKMMMERGGHTQKSPKQKEKKTMSVFPHLFNSHFGSFCRSPRDSRDLRLPGGRDYTSDTSEDSINT